MEEPKASFIYLRIRYIFKDKAVLGCFPLGLSDALQECGDGHLQSFANFGQGADRDILLAALDLAHVSPMNPANVREMLL